jgi:hypothetical protein
VQRPRNSKHRSPKAAPAPKAARGGRAVSAQPAGVPFTTVSSRFGEVPVLRYTWTDASGVERQGLQYDPDYAPLLPNGAVRGDVRKQPHGWRVPFYFYEDEERACVQCGGDFTFSAQEQKYWYETLKFSLRSTAIRCPPCRRVRRSGKAAQRALEAAHAVLRSQPDDPQALIAVAEATVRHAQQLGQAPLAQAVAASRRARRLLRSHPTRESRETYFWEGLASALAGERERARENLSRFLALQPSGRREVGLGREAERWLASHPVGAPAAAPAEPMSLRRRARKR